MNIRRILLRLADCREYQDANEIIDIIQLGKVEKTDFEEWWYGCGSGLAPMPGEDSEDHAKRVCETFYKHLFA